MLTMSGKDNPRASFQNRNVFGERLNVSFSQRFRALPYVPMRGDLQAGRSDKECKIIVFEIALRLRIPTKQRHGRSDM